MSNGSAHLDTVDWPNQLSVDRIATDSKAATRSTDRTKELKRYSPSPRRFDKTQNSRRQLVTFRKSAAEIACRCRSMDGRIESAAAAPATWVASTTTRVAGWILLRLLRSSRRCNESNKIYWKPDGRLAWTTDGIAADYQRETNYRPQWTSI